MDPLFIRDVLFRITFLNQAQLLYFSHFTPYQLFGLSEMNKSQQNLCEKWIRNVNLDKVKLLRNLAVISGDQGRFKT